MFLGEGRSAHPGFGYPGDFSSSGAAEPGGWKCHLVCLCIEENLGQRNISEGSTAGGKCCLEGSKPGIQSIQKGENMKGFAVRLACLGQTVDQSSDTKGKFLDGFRGELAESGPETVEDDQVLWR